MKRTKHAQTSDIRTPCRARPHRRRAGGALRRDAKALEEQRENRNIDGLDFEERLALLVDRETVERETKRLATRLKAANLRQDAAIEDLDPTTKRSLDVMAEPCSAWTRCSPSSPPANGSAGGRT